MAHEIRNPLTTIVGFVKLIRNQLPSVDPIKLKEYLDIIDREYINIQMQITGFLGFSKKNVMEEPFVAITSSALITAVLEMATPRLINENIHFINQVAEESELLIQKVAIQQVMSNLLNNSIDALAEKEEDKRLKVEGYYEGDQYVISVSNNGPEIPEAIRSSLFQPFVSGKRDGTGLGLAICKQIMIKNNGNINFISNAEQTTFYIKFNLNTK